MKIAFLCSSLEPGRDGVGDYTRRLAGELIRQGHPSVMVGLNDVQISKTVFESQTMENVSVPALRLPGVMPWGERAVKAREWLDVFQPDWVSLQFVPFGFHPKGMSLDLSRHLRVVIGSRPLHWMFHELWVLWSFPLSLRKRLLGQGQKLCLRAGLKKLKPEKFATQLPLHQTELRKIGVTADLLPLHGNIPVCAKAEAGHWLGSRCAPLRISKCFKAGFFGNILSTLDAASFAEQVTRLNIPKDELLLLSAGKLSPESARRWRDLEREFKTVGTFLALGELNEREASWYFSALNAGFTAYPVELMGKSGSVAAMREHGLPVISCGKKLSEDGNPSSATEASWTVEQSASVLLHHLQSRAA